MRIVVFQAEIEEALENHILEQISVPDDMRIDISFKASRGEEGYQAFIDIVRGDAPKGIDHSVDPRIAPIEGQETLGIAEKVAAAKAQGDNPVRRRGRPPGSKNKPKDGSGVAEAAAPVAQTEATVENPLASTEPVEAPTTDDLREKLQQSVAQTEEAPQEPTAEPEVVTEAEPTPQVVEEPMTEVEPTVTEAPIEVPAETETETKEEVLEPTPETVVEAQPEPEVETPKPATRSLFANLGKPADS